MKVLLFLNGFEGCQTGIEDGFLNLVQEKQITELKWFYYLEYAKQHSAAEAREEMLKLASDLQPDVIVFFHIGNLSVDKNFIMKFKNLQSSPLLVYDEGDMYGTWAKPVYKSMKVMFSLADVVSIRGLGAFEDTVRKSARNVIYTPHHNDIARHLQDPFVLAENKEEIILIGNRIKPRFLSKIRRLPGAVGRESFARAMASYFPDQFHLYGNGWNDFECNRGPVGFYEQNEYYRNALITVAYEHYPEIPYYFSNRLPMALMNGSLYVCHYHGGYDEIFPKDDFIFFFRSNEEARDIIEQLRSMSPEDLRLRSERAREFALQHYHPNVIWSNFFTKILAYGSK